MLTHDEKHILYGLSTQSLLFVKKLDRPGAGLALFLFDSYAVYDVLYKHWFYWGYRCASTLSGNLTTSCDRILLKQSSINVLT